MLYFACDYQEGAHEQVLLRLAETNYVSQPGYGKDYFCAAATEKIRLACAAPSADVFYIVGGTLTNAVVLSALLKPGEGVFCAQSGHINVHEAGAIENTGHVILQRPSHHGKLCPDDLEEWLDNHHAVGDYVHTVLPGAVYLSHPTEYGTLYTYAELKRISDLCKQHGLLLYLDGARLGYALACPENDLSLADISYLVDVFYIGGTKVGALCGEAVVFPRANAPKHFMNHMKRSGAVMAKGRVLGVQFDALFTDDLYRRLGAVGIAQAKKLKELLHRKNIRMWLETPTNQQFVILENGHLKRLLEHVAPCVWGNYDDKHTIVRFTTSWATTDAMLEELEKWL